MILSGQEWKVDDNFLILEVREPYWSAWLKFGWEKGVEGYSISASAIEKAEELKKDIRIKNRHGDFRISPEKARESGKPFTTSNGTALICIPRTSFI